MLPVEGGEAVAAGKAGLTTVTLVELPGEHVVLPHVKGPPPPPVHPDASKSAPLHTSSMSACVQVPPPVLSSIPPAPLRVNSGPEHL